MREVEFSVPRKCDMKLAERLVEGICADRGLKMVLEGRKAAWIDSELPRLRREVEKKLKGFGS